MQQPEERASIPYALIETMQELLANGQNFSDWTFAQNALSNRNGRSSSSGSDWFPVNEELVDRNDPDCVVRARTRTIGAGNVMEMWSPVRWVALLVKLSLPLQTIQVRMLDSGEADTYRYEGGTWVRNPNRLVLGDEAHPHQQGVLRRSQLIDGKIGTTLFINNDKVNTGTTGPENGYTVAWPEISKPLHQNIHYWIEKLRNWQERYNPIVPMQQASGLASCFLFRCPEAKQTDKRNVPCTEMVIERSWQHLLTALEQRLSEEGKTAHDGSRIRLVRPREDNYKGSRTLFPLSSLRHSMVRALGSEGNIPLPVLTKLFGRSRLMMTIYYIHPASGLDSQLSAQLRP